MASPAFTFTADVRPICQIGLSAARQAEPDSWLDVSCYVHECELFRGRDRFTDRFQPGTATATFDNRTGWGDLVGSPAVVAGQTLRPGRPIRFGVAGPWDDIHPSVRWLWRGWIDQCVPFYDPRLHDIVSINCVDSLGEAGAAPVAAGPMQGANESVGKRIHRILDARGWWASKRRIDDDSGITVQGTTFGGQGIDLMGQAADSAGGVIFGDVDGDIVFRDLNWMLYDPDVPPDGVIGNVAPGTPGIPYVPGYLDPTLGYVWWPDPPPLLSPTVMTVCAADGSGSLIAQGDAANLYVDNEQLRFASSGRVWDLGEFHGGCVGVTFDPDTGEVHRVDDLDGDGVWTVDPVPATELPPPSIDIELLAWSQAGPAAAAQNTISLGPVTPGRDCVLLVFAACQPTSGGTAPMSPTITGGPLGYTLLAERDGSPYAGMWEAVWAVDVARDAPGTYTVTIDWPGTKQSRIHAAALYRVRDMSSSYRRRMFYGGGHEGGEATPQASAGAGVGNGPLAMNLLDAEGWTPIVRTEDAVVALSLAHSTTAPFGAVFGAGGTWTVPPPVSGITRTVSWSTGIRFGSTSPIVDWADINTAAGADLAKAAQAVYLQPIGPPRFEWRTIYDVITTGSVAGGTINLIPINPLSGATLVVFVSFTASTDMVDTITCTHPTMAFTEILTQHKTGSSWGQGAVFTATVPQWAPPTPEPPPTLHTSSPPVVTGTGVANLVSASFTAPGGACLVVRYWSPSNDGTFDVTVSDSGGLTWQYSDADGNGIVWAWAFTTTAVARTVTVHDNTTPAASVAKVAVYTDVMGVAAAGGSSSSSNIFDLTVGSGGRDNVLTVGVGVDSNALGVPASSTPDVDVATAHFAGIASIAMVDDSTILNDGDLGTLRFNAFGSAAAGWFVSTLAVYGRSVPATFDVAWTGTPESVSVVVYEVYGMASIGGVASGVLGTNTDGSVDGSSTISLNDTPHFEAATLATIHVKSASSATNGAQGATGWVEQAERRHTTAGYVQSMSRAGSVTPQVTWTDVQTGTGLAKSGVQLAVEVRPAAGFSMAPSEGFDLVIGGAYDPYTGRITYAQRKTGVDPNSGTTVWEFNPSLGVP